MTNGLKIERGYFGLGSPQETVVKVTSTADFTISLWARNVETSPAEPVSRTKFNGTRRRPCARRPSANRNGPRLYRLYRRSRE
jgi:hypothetical protein